jgi:hypothetical protein
MMFRITAATTFLVLAVVSTSSIVEANDDRSITCYDYSDVFNNLNLGPDECNERRLIIRVRDHFRFQHDNPETQVKCRGGLGRELMALTNTTGLDFDAAKRQLQYLCDDALLDASESAILKKNTWESLESEPHSIGTYCISTRVHSRLIFYQIDCHLIYDFSFAFAFLFFFSQI